LIRGAAYYLTAYGYYSGGRIAALSFLYEMRYRMVRKQCGLSQSCESILGPSSPK
jgi:hypothetical protein